MKSASSALALHYQQDVLTVARCLKVTLTNGTVKAFTSHSDDIPLEGVTYVSGMGTVSDVETNSTLAVDNLELLAAFDPDIVKQADVRNGLWDYAAVEIFEVNYNDLTQGKLIIRKGNLGPVKHGRFQLSVELVGLGQRLNQTIGEVTTPTCRADLGDVRCKIDLDAFARGRVAFTVSAVTSRRQFADLTVTDAADWYAGGLVTFSTGLNAGLSREVKSSTALGVFSLQDAFPYDIAVSDTGIAQVGCSKIIQVCNDKFANTVNFRGEPHLPGVNRMLSGT